MALSPKKKNRQTDPNHTRHKALECVPVKNPQVSEEEQENGELRLQYQVRVRPWFHGVVKKITKSSSTVINRTLQLDILGASVWQMIDGKKSVRKIIDEFQKVHQLDRKEAEISVTTFLKQLGERGLIAMREVE